MLTFMRKDQIFEKITTELHKYFSPKASVEHNQKILGKSGVNRQVDVLIKDEVATYPLVIAVDCKYYTSKVDINEIEKTWGLVDDIRANLGVIISNAGFTEGAKKRATELGRLKLCSILDLENKDFSIKLSLPVIAEFRKPVFRFKVSGNDPNISFSPDVKSWEIKNSGGEIKNLYKHFLNMWNNNKIPHDTGQHAISLSTDEWKLICSMGDVSSNVLEIHYEVIPRFYLGLVPLIEGKGIVDIQENLLKTKSITTDMIHFEIIEKNWEMYDKLSDIKTKPVIHFVCSDMFEN